MRLAIVSDLHYEFGTQVPVTLDRDVDVLILAGDIDNAKNTVQRAKEIAAGRAQHVVLIPGNHEYYGMRVDKAWEAMQSEDNVHVLLDDYFDYEGYRFVGSTLWTDYNLYGNAPLAMMQARESMNDFRRIKVCAKGVYRRLLPEDVVAMHNNAKRFIWDQIGEAYEEKRLNKLVVVTHHGPTHMSVHPRYGSDALNAAYSNNWGERIAYTGPRLWVHGHTHDPADYTCGQTRVVANPWGYPGERADPSILYMEV